MTKHTGPTDVKLFVGDSFGELELTQRAGAFNWECLCSRCKEYSNVPTEKLRSGVAKACKKCNGGWLRRSESQTKIQDTNDKLEKQMEGIYALLGPLLKYFTDIKQRTPFDQALLEGLEAAFAITDEADEA